MNGPEKQRDAASGKVHRANPQDVQEHHATRVRSGAGDTVSDGTTVWDFHNARAMRASIFRGGDDLGAAIVELAWKTNLAVAAGTIPGRQITPGDVVQVCVVSYYDGTVHRPQTTDDSPRYASLPYRYVEAEDGDWTVEPALPPATLVHFRLPRSVGELIPSLPEERRQEVLISLQIKEAAHIDPGAAAAGPAGDAPAATYVVSGKADGEVKDFLGFLIDEELGLRGHAAPAAAAGGDEKRTLIPPSVVQFCARRDGLPLPEFLEEARAGAAKLLAGYGDDDPGRLYGMRIIWNHREKRTRTSYVRIMGTEGAREHEVWLTLWCREGAETRRMEDRAILRDEWARGDDPVDGRTYSSGRTVLGFDHDGRTVSLIHRETRDAPFSGPEYRARLADLFGKAGSLVSAGKREDGGEDAPPAAEETPVAEFIDADADADVEAEAIASEFHTPESLVKALAAGTVELYRQRQPVRISSCEGTVVVANDVRGRKVVVTLNGVSVPDRAALDSLWVGLEDRRCKIARAGEDGLVIRRSFDRMPEPSELREVLDYAARLLAEL